jgi:hypothetical protein
MDGLKEQRTLRDITTILDKSLEFINFSLELSKGQTV